ncbi:MAG: hypothetical protein DI626_01035 [Micavibrio aeruginosavorus]|uniref:Flagellar protein FlaG n=1 Tax=Micavibrio aeruginosavorus TaxID=349221 RepID=A0A2W5A6C2_9BACT|nr:MAG: hypothetical protein DI626_01035 [Micavibrio aeruginosavorus]
MNSFAANPDRVQQASLQAPYVSLYIKVDVNFDKALLLMRDSDTGDVVRQIPSETQLEAYRRAQKVLNPEVPVIKDAEDAKGDSEVTAAGNSSSVPAQAVSTTPAPQTSAPTQSVSTETVSIDTSV